MHTHTHACTYVRSIARFFSIPLCRLFDTHKGIFWYTQSNMYLNACHAAQNVIIVLSHSNVLKYKKKRARCTTHTSLFTHYKHFFLRSVLFVTRAYRCMARPSLYFTWHASQHNVKTRVRKYLFSTKHTHTLYGVICSPYIFVANNLHYMYLCM